MAGINLSQLNIPKSEEPVKRKHVIRLDELSEAYSNPEKIKENFHNEPVKKGELKKLDTLKKIDQKLEKIEQRTESLLVKAEKQKDDQSRSATTGNDMVTNPSVSGNKKRSPATKKKPSYFEFLCLKGIPRAIARHISINMFLDKSLNQYICAIDSDEINKVIGKESTAEVANTIWRMQASGWFKTLHFSTSGVRLVLVENPEFFLSK